MCMPAHANFALPEPLFGILAADNKYRPFRFESIFVQPKTDTGASSCTIPNEGEGGSNIFLNQATNTLTGSAHTTFIFLNRPNLCAL